jgi:hypothetical protein
MMQQALTASRRYRRRGGAYASRAFGGFALIVMHEIDALTRHAVDVRERLAVAREAPGLVELVRDQVDLLAETRARLAFDQRERRALLNSWIADLRSAA